MSSAGAAPALKYAKEAVMPSDQEANQVPTANKAEEETMSSAPVRQMNIVPVSQSAEGSAMPTEQETSSVEALGKPERDQSEAGSSSFVNDIRKGIKDMDDFL